MSEPPRGMQRPLLLGHRGCRGPFPENTFAAFDHALASGCDGFEFDVRRTSDGVGLICHDAILFRRSIARNAYSTLRALGDQPRGALLRKTPPVAMCCLDEILARYARSAFLNIELKVAGLEDSTARLWKQHPGVKGAISSFLPDVVTCLHKLLPDLPVGFIFDRRAGLRQWRELPTTHVMPHHSFVTSALIADMHAEDRKVITWTVNDVRKMRKFAEWGIDGLISDDPVLLSNSFGWKA